MTQRGVPLTVPDQIADIYAKLRARKPSSSEVVSSVEIEVDGLAIGPASILNFLTGANVTLTGEVADGLQVNVTISAITGGGHDHMGAGTDSTVVYGLSDATPAQAAGTESMAGGNGAVATSNRSIVFGPEALDGVDGEDIVMGWGADTSGGGGQNIAIGTGAYVRSKAYPTFDDDGYDSVAIGWGVEVFGNFIVAIGEQAVADDDLQVVIGGEAQAAWGVGDTLIGATAYVYGGSGSAGIDGYKVLIGYGAHGRQDKSYSTVVGAESYSAHSYASVLGAQAHSTNDHQVMLATGAERMYSGVPNSAVTDADIPTSMMTAWIDESLNTLNFRVLYSDGTSYKSASVALV